MRGVFFKKKQKPPNSCGSWSQGRWKGQWDALHGSHKFSVAAVLVPLTPGLLGTMGMKAVRHGTAMSQPPCPRGVC